MQVIIWTTSNTNARFHKPYLDNPAVSDRSPSTAMLSSISSKGVCTAFLGLGCIHFFDRRVISSLRNDSSMCLNITQSFFPIHNFHYLQSVWAGTAGFAVINAGTLVNRLQCWGLNGQCGFQKIISVDLVVRINLEEGCFRLMHFIQTNVCLIFTQGTWRLGGRSATNRICQRF